MYSIIQLPLSQPDEKYKGVNKTQEVSTTAMKN